MPRGLALFIIGVFLLAAPLAGAADAQTPATYQVRIFNLTAGQPFSPIVAATHKENIALFRVGRPASDQIEAIAEDGDQAPMVAVLNALQASGRVTDVVDVGRPLTTLGKTVGAFTPWVSFEIQAAAGDKFSFATMLICTNDGFLGLDAVNLPQRGQAAYLVNGYDAGTEDNTEQSTDIVDPCSALGPEALPGDPDGNDEAGVNTVPAQAIRMHPGIQGTGELKPELHGWQNPVALVIIDRK